LWLIASLATSQNREKKKNQEKKQIDFSPKKFKKEKNNF